MKIRSGFVSNSSSSSFICAVCNASHTGYDIGLSECEMSECTEGHTFCDEHMPDKSDTFDDRVAKVKKYLKEDFDGSRGEKLDAEDRLTTIIKEKDDCDLEDWISEIDDGDDCYELDPSKCPICTLKSLNDFEALAYLLKKSGQTKEDLAVQVKSEFGTYKKYKSYVGEVDGVVDCS